LFQSVITAGRRADDGDIFSFPQHGNQAFAEQAIVIDDEYANGVIHPESHRIKEIR